MLSAVFFNISSEINCWLSLRPLHNRIFWIIEHQPVWIVGVGRVERMPHNLLPPLMRCLQCNTHNVLRHNSIIRSHRYTHTVELRLQVRGGPRPRILTATTWTGNWNRVSSRCPRRRTSTAAAQENSWKWTSTGHTVASATVRRGMRSSPPRRVRRQTSKCTGEVLVRMRRTPPPGPCRFLEASDAPRCSELSWIQHRCRDSGTAKRGRSPGAPVARPTSAPRCLRRKVNRNNINNNNNNNNNNNTLDSRIFKRNSQQTYVF